MSNDHQAGPEGGKQESEDESSVKVTRAQLEAEYPDIGNNHEIIAWALHLELED